MASEAARTSLWDGPEPSPHTTLARAADLVVVAPATARLLAAYATGLADDLLVATLLATRAPVVLCPAMHSEMWDHPAVQANVATLGERGAHLVGPDEGTLAGGDVGRGRLAEPAAIVAACAGVLDGAEAGGHVDRAPVRDLDGLAVLITAGGTREPLDPVRFLGNRSSGKQGHALAAEAAFRGARVTLVTASAAAAPPGVEVQRVDTAAEMESAVLSHSDRADVVVMAAAVADFRPVQVATTKLHRREGLPEVVLEPTPDILAGLVTRRRPGQIVVGFAAEWGDPRPGARAKLATTGADVVVANDVSAPETGFDADTNAVVIVSASGMELNVGPSTKRDVARAVLDAVVAHRSVP